MTYDDLRALGERTRDEAALRIREAFHKRWGFFIKCVACGGRIDANFPADQILCALCPCGSRTFQTSGYSR